MDFIFNIALHTDYKTTLNLIKAYPIYFKNKNIWKSKCEYNGAPYYEFFAENENFLIYEKNNFEDIFNNNFNNNCQSHYNY